MIRTADDLAKHCIKKVERQIEKSDTNLDSKEIANVYASIAISLLHHIFDNAQSSEDVIIANCKKIETSLISWKREKGDEVCSSSSRH